MTKSPIRGIAQFQREAYNSYTPENGDANANKSHALDVLHSPKRYMQRVIVKGLNLEIASS
jgi:hypothetical protein